MPELLTVTSVAEIATGGNVVPFPFTKVRVDVTHVRGKIHKTVDFVAVAGAFSRMLTAIV
jgi:hypothetical protein